MPDLYSYLFDIHQALKRRGQDLDDATLKELARHVAHPEVMQAMQSGQLTGEQIADQAMQAMQVAGQRRSMMGQQMPRAPAPMMGQAMRAM